MPRLLLVRHGQSEWNAAGRWQGQADPPLSDFGRIQARHAAAAVGGVDAVYASTLGRAVETATIIGTQLGVGPVLVEHDLRERNAGEFSGLTRIEIEDRFPGYLAEGRRPPGWESDELLLARASAALLRIAADAGDEVLVVTHGGVIMTLEVHLGLERRRCANLGGRWFDVSPDGIVPGGHVDLLHGAEITVPDQI